MTDTKELIALKFDSETGIYQAIMQAEPCNEIGLEMLSALENMLDQIDCDSGRVLVISSALDKGFCAGADLKELYRKFIETPESEHSEKLRDFINRIHSVANRIDMLPLLTIGVVHGVCFGGGFELALTCDILVAEKSARFCFPELRLGIIPGFGGIPRLKRDLGNAVVRDIIFTGRSLNAKKAQSLGLVSQVVARGEGQNVALKMAQHLQKFDHKARVLAKQFTKSLPSAELETEKELFLELVQRDVVQAALKKFAESTDIRPYI